MKPRMKKRASFPIKTFPPRWKRNDSSSGNLVSNKLPARFLPRRYCDFFQCDLYPGVCRLLIKEIISRTLQSREPRAKLFSKLTNQFVNDSLQMKFLENEKCLSIFINIRADLFFCLCSIFQSSIFSVQTSS